MADPRRLFLYEFHDESLIERAKRLRPSGTVAFIPAESELLAGLARVSVASVHAIAARGKGTRATLDHDATIQESHKREALPHYRGGRGYQPACIYWAEQDLVIGDEYRDGNVPAGMGNLPLIEKAFQSLPDKVRDRFFRADSACYEAAVRKWLADPERTSKGRIGFVPRGRVEST
ncbi:MAG: transposase [Deltaproteobacteria bacterium]|nr:transposase [Deltaproteobacteria bacterium]